MRACAGMHACEWMGRALLGVVGCECVRVCGWLARGRACMRLCMQTGVCAACGHAGGWVGVLRRGMTWRAWRGVAWRESLQASFHQSICQVRVCVRGLGGKGDRHYYPEVVGTGQS